jgi:hypothetical protein
MRQQPIIIKRLIKLMKREIIIKRLIITKWLTGIPFMLMSIMNMPQSITLRRIRIIILSILSIRVTNH